jgi:glutaredoxin
MENKIVMFSKPGCKYCENARSFLNTLQLQYKEIKLKPDEKNYEKKNYFIRFF